MSRLCFLILMVVVFWVPSIALARQVPEPQLPRTLDEALGPILNLQSNNSYYSQSQPSSASILREPARLESGRFPADPSGAVIVASPELNQSFGSINDSNVYRKPTPAIPAKALNPKRAPAPSIPLGLQSPSVAAPDDVDPPPFFLANESSSANKSARNSAESRSVLDQSRIRRGPTVDNLSDSPQLAPPRWAEEPSLDSKLSGEFATSSLRVKVIAPEKMVSGQTNELTVEVLNFDAQKSTPVEVRLAIPAGLTITRFDRDAWLNDQERTITFSLPSIPGQHKQSIRLQGVSHVQGQQDLQVSLVSQDQMLDRSVLAMEVIDGSDALRNANSDNATNRPPIPRAMNR